MTLHAVANHPQGGGDIKVPANKALATLSGSSADMGATAPTPPLATAASCRQAPPRTTWFTRATLLAITTSGRRPPLARRSARRPPPAGRLTKNSSCRINRGNWIIPKGSHSAMFQVSATSNPVMGASGIATASATLNLPRYSVAQWRKRTDIANQTGRSRGTAATESLNNLTEADSYTYKAYSKDSCNGADEIATVTFSTTTTNQN